MDGRWTIKQNRTSYGVIQQIGGAKVPREATPVVPCDDAAVERAAAALEHEMMDRAGGDEYLYGMDDDVRAEFLTDLAETVLRAAGEVFS
jgi:hypothetical protein